MVTIKEGDFVKISYTGKLEDGTVFDTTYEEVARENNIFSENARYGGDVIIIGLNQVIPGLEDDIKLHEPGYEGTTTIPPEKAFGERIPRLLRDLPIKRFQEEPQVGMQVQMDGRTGTVLKVMGRHARVDFNTPMAGQTVTYDYKIESVLEDLKDKVMGLTALITGKELDTEIEGTAAIINVPLEYNYSQRWVSAKSQMALDLLKHTGLTQVRYVETYTEDLLKEKPAAGSEIPEEA